MGMGEMDYTGYVSHPVAEDLMEMTFIYAELRFSYGLDEALEDPFAGWKERFEAWADEFEESHADFDWDVDNYDEEILNFTLDKIDGYLSELGHEEKKASDAYPEIRKLAHAVPSRDGDSSYDDMEAER